MAALNFGGANLAPFFTSGASSVNLVALAGPTNPYVENAGAVGTTGSIDVQQGATMNFQWTVGGLFCGLWAPPASWRCDVYFEALGNPFSVPALNAVTPHIPTIANQVYNVAVSIPAGAVPVGIYRVTARVMLTDQLSPAQHPVVAFSDLGVIEFFQA